MSSALTVQYKKLLRHHGPQHWWPITTVEGARRPPPKPLTDAAAFEIAVGAILTQNTAWTNVVKALMNLKRARLLNVKAILNTPTARLAKLIKPSGYYRQKAKKLKALCAWLNREGGSLKRWSGRTPLAEARTELLTVHGIGPETADSILLYACGRTTFVIDAYTKRFASTFGIKFKQYEEYQRYFEARLPRSTKLYQEFHALIVAWGKHQPPHTPSLAWPTRP